MIGSLTRRLARRFTFPSSAEPGADATAVVESAAPCIVLGLDSQIGLHLVRELGKAGVRVIGIAHDPSEIGLKSRYLWKGIVSSPPRSENLRLLIVELGRQYGPCPLITVSEPNLAWLTRNAGTFGSVRPVLPPPEALAIVRDKSSTLFHARAVGIDVPQSFQPTAGWTLAEVLSAVRLPCVLKWSDTSSVAAQLRSKGLRLLKAEYANTEADLSAALHRYDGIGRWPLVQSYCPGVGLGQFFFMQEGRALRRFQHIRIAEWPPEGGFSSVCESVPLDQHRELQERSVELLRNIGWTGVAMVEYRYDPATGRAVLMEVNGRFWGSFPLACHAGAGFAALTYSQALGLPVTNMPPPRAGLRCRMVATELKRLARIVFQRDRIADRHFVARPASEIVRFVFDFLRPGVRYYVWAWDDPQPFLADLGNFLSARLRRRQLSRDRA